MATYDPVHAMLFDTAVRYFLEVARTGSIAAAAAQLHVANSAISRQIAKLEESVGAPLFERRARGMVLSVAGTTLAAYMRNTVLEGERVLGELRTELREGLGAIRIACTDGFSGGLLADVMSGFREEHPECAFTVHVGDPDSINGQVVRGEVDLGLKFSIGPERGLRVEHQQPAPILLATAPGPGAFAAAGDLGWSAAELGEDVSEAWDDALAGYVAPGGGHVPR